MSRRVPQTGPEMPIYVWPEGETPATTIAYGELTAATLAQPEYGRRQAALGLLAEMACCQGDVAVSAIEAVMTRDASFTELLIALLLLEALGENAPLPLDRIEEQLQGLAGSGSFALSGAAARLLAMEAIDAPARRLPPPPAAPVVTDDELREALVYDYDRRTELVARLWNRFPQTVARLYWRLWRSSERHESIRKGQGRVQFSRTSRWMLPLPMHDWCRELLEVALDQAVPAVRAQLIRSGRWRPRLDDEIREVLAPDVAASAARAQPDRPPGGSATSRSRC